MGYFIARDGQQLGPINPDQVAEGLAIGALRSTDLAWTEGMQGWRPLFEVFASAAAAPSRVPPPLPPQPPVPAPMASKFTLPPAVSGPSKGGSVQTSGLAVASLVLGILSPFLFILTGVPAMICGYRALAKIKRSAGTLKGGGFAMAGIIIASAWCCLIMCGLLLAIIIPNLGNVNMKARESMVSRGMNHVLGALKKYAAAHDGEYPPTLETALPGSEFAASLASFATPPGNWTQETGFDYLAAGLKTAEAGSRLVLISRAKGPNGERIAVHNDGTVTFGPLDDPR